MPGLGTIVNAAAIILGGFAGLLFGKLIKPRVQETIMTACGVCVLFLGIGGAMEKMLTSAADGTLSSGGTMMLIASVVLGGLVGALLNIEGAMERFGKWLRKITHSEGDGGFVDGFVTASLTVCIGAMAVVGSLQSGLTGSHDMLFTKSLLDGISAIVLTASLGIGVGLSAVSVLIYQGAITLLAGLLAPVLTDAVVAEMTCVGSMLIFALGLNMIGVTKIKVMDFVPAIFLVIPLCYVL